MAVKNKGVTGDIRLSDVKELNTKDKAEVFDKIITQIVRIVGGDTEDFLDSIEINPVRGKGRPVWQNASQESFEGYENQAFTTYLKYLKRAYRISEHLDNLNITKTQKEYSLYQNSLDILLQIMSTDEHKGLTFRQLDQIFSVLGLEFEELYKASIKEGLI